MKLRLPITVALLFCLMSSACLKTRAQLREENDDREGAGPSKPVPSQVQDVQPQGQYAVDEMKAELTRLEGRIEDLERAQKQTSQNPSGASKEDVKKLEQRVIELENAQAQMIEQLKKSQEEVQQTKADPAELIDKARAQYKAANYSGAVETLNTYLKSAKKGKTEEPTFLRAESYYKLKQYKKAIVDYSKFPEKYTKSKLMPQVLYKIGLCFDNLGMRDDAKGFYQELIEKFPKSPEAKKARPKAR